MNAAPTPGQGQPAQQPEIPPFDPANPFTAERPEQLLTVAPVPTGNGQRLAICMRVGNATVTAVMDKTAAMSWAHLIRTQAAKVSDLLIAPPGAVPPPNLNGKGPHR
jgi:hypothetical protein